MTANYCLACVASVSNRVMARKLEREQKKTFFCSRPNFSRRTRAETFATEANYCLTRVGFPPPQLLPFAFYLSFSLN